MLLRINKYFKGEYQGVFNVSSDNVVEMPQSDEDDIFDPREGWDEDLRWKPGKRSDSEVMIFSPQ